MHVEQNILIYSVAVKELDTLLHVDGKEWKHFFNRVMRFLDELNVRI